MLLFDKVLFHDRAPLFESLSLHCARGEVVGVTGPSGVGKTTLLNLAVGGLVAQGGKVRVSGLSPSEAVEKQLIGLVPQANTLLPNRTVRGNVALPLMLKRDVYTWRSLPSADREQVEWAMGAAQIGHASELLPSQLSAGMAARAMLARAIVHHPSLLLVDEGLANLDEVTCEGIYASLQAIIRSFGMSGIVVSHRIAEVVRLASRVLVLRRDDVAGPTEIMHEEAIPLGWPRGATVLEDPIFIRACARIRANLGIGRGT